MNQLSCHDMTLKAFQSETVFSETNTQKISGKISIGNTQADFLMKSNYIGIICTTLKTQIQVMPQ